MRQLIDAPFQPFRSGIGAALQESGPFLNHLANRLIQGQLSLQRLFLRHQRVALRSGSTFDLFVELFNFRLHLRDARGVASFHLRGALYRTSTGRSGLFCRADSRASALAAWKASRTASAVRLCSFS